ncbi:MULTISPECIES: tetratricopeptide repeat protein [Dissulfurimicrobium]
MISGHDFACLAPLLIEELKTKFPFASGRAVVIQLDADCPYDEALNVEALSGRQLSRAREAIEKADAFLDRVGLKMFIPVPCEGRLSGLLVLSGIPRAVGPEEDGRILSLLKAYAKERMRTLRIETSIAPPGEPPQYLVLFLKHLFQSEKEAESSFLHLVWAKTHRSVGRSSRSRKANAGKIYDKEAILGLCARVWTDSTFEWAGGNRYEAWICLPHMDGSKLSLGLRDIVAKGRGLGLFFFNVYGHSFAGGTDPQLCLEHIKETEAAAEALGISVISSRDLEIFKKRIGIQDVTGCLAIASDICRKARNTIVAFARPVSQRLKDVHTEGLEFIEAGPDSVFIIQKSSDSDQHQAITKDLADRLLKPNLLKNGVSITLGVYKVSSRATSPLPALYAYLHAVLLGQGTSAVFDAVTLNVWGDELFSWGDLVGACRAYREGLKMDPSSSNLLNSLGVSLARLGKIKEASDAFSRAIKSSPDEFMAYYNLGGLLLDMGRAEEAEEALGEAYRLKPDDIRTAVRFAEVLLDAGKTDEAERVLRPFTNIYARQIGQEDIPAAVFRVIGRMAYNRQGGWRKAKEAWSEAVKRNPADIQSLAFLAFGYLEVEGDKDTARRFLRQVKAVDIGGRQMKRLISTIEKGIIDASIVKR